MKRIKDYIVLHIKDREYFSGVLIFLLLLLTQINIGLPVSFSESGTAKIAVAEFILIAAGLYLVVYKWMIKREFKLHTLMGKIVAISIVLMGFYYVITLIYRIYMRQSIAGNFLVTRVLILSVIMFLIIDAGMFTIKSVGIGIFAFTTIINFAQVFNVLARGIVPRSSTLLGNINVYDSLMVMLLLIFMYILSRYDKHANAKSVLMKVLFWVNFNIALFAIFLSGSRFAFIAYILLATVLFAILFKHVYSLKRILAATLIIVLYLASFVMLIQAGIPSISVHASRSLYYPIKVLQSMNIIGEIDIPADINPDDDVESLVSRSDNLRATIQSKAIREIRNNFWIGSGRPDVYVSGWGYQSAHNFVLEYMMCYGIIGFILCMFILFTPLVFILFKLKIPISLKICGLLLYSTILLFSFVQPIISTKLTIMAIMWSVIGIISLESTEHAG